MFGYGLVALGVILLTGAHANPVASQDHETDSAYLSRPSLEDELRDLPYEDLPKLEEEANSRGMQLIASQSDKLSRMQEPIDRSAESSPQDDTRTGTGSAGRHSGNLAYQPPAPHPSHLIDIDSNVHPSALATPTGDLDPQEHEWRPEDDEKDDDDDGNDDVADDDEDDDEEDDEDDDHDDVTTKPPASGDVAVEKKSGADDHRPPTAIAQQQPPSSALPPTYIREAYFLAKEDKTESSVGGGGEEDKSGADSPTVGHHVESTEAPSIELDLMKPELARRQESRPRNPTALQGGKTNGQKEQFAEVVVKLAGEHDPITASNDPPQPTAGRDDEAEASPMPVHRDGGNVEVSNGNNQNRGSSSIDAFFEAAAAAATTDSNDDDDAQLSDVGPTHVGPVEEDEDQLESELEQEEDRIKDEISQRMRSIGIGKQLVKKVMPSDAPGPRGGDKEDSANEDILELIIKVAERPSSWKEIKELLEKIQYEENTLNKAKARLRALAKQKQMKIRREQKTKENKLGKNRTKYNPKDRHNDTKEHNFNRADMTPGEQPKVGNHRVVVTQHEPARVPLTRNDDIIKAEVFPSASRHHNNDDDGVGGSVHRPATKHAKHHHSSRRPAVDAIGSGDHDHEFAIEKPVTVIGERSRVDPVEKELIEASTNQRLREIQIEKARLAAIPEPTDEMEQQLKALTKMERRLKEHWRQKQKLIQKIRETNGEHAKW